MNGSSTPPIPLDGRRTSRSVNRLTLTPAFAALLAGAACATAGSPAPASTVTAAPAASVPISRFAGEWEGVYYTHPHPMGIKLTLSQVGANGVEGEVHHYPLRESRSVMRPTEGRFSVRGTYDPVLRTYSLTPGAWIQRPRQGGTPFALQGVFDPDQPALAGTFGVRQNQTAYFYTLTRPDRAADLTGRALLNPPRVRGGRRVGDDVLVRWASRLTEEHPDVDPRRTESRRLFVLASNLFEDEYFREHFGKTFDLMSNGERGAVRERFARTSRISTARPGTLKAMMQREPNQELREFSLLGRAFDGAVSPGGMDIVTMVLAQRVIRAWRAGQLARIAELPPTSAAIEDLDRALVAGETNLSTLWPSERAAFAATVSTRQRELAGPALRASANELVGTANGYEGARAPGSWFTSNQRLLSLAPTADRQAVTAQVAQRLDEILAPLVARDATGIEALGAGLEAVIRGNTWYQTYRGRYGFAMARPVVDQPVRRLREMRPRHLGQAEEEVVLLIRGSRTEREVDELVREVLAVPDDQATAAGRAILAAADARKLAIRREAYLPWLALAGGLITVGCHVDMRDADQNREYSGSFTYRLCRRLAAEFTVRSFAPDLTPGEVVEVTDLVLGVLDGRIVDRETTVDRLVRDLRARNPNRNWTTVAAESLLETVESRFPSP
jgi:hypothetical protein